MHKIFRRRKTLSDSIWDNMKLPNDAPSIKWIELLWRGE